MSKINDDIIMYSNYGKVIYMNLVLAIHLSLCLSLTSLLPEIAL